VLAGTRWAFALVVPRPVPVGFLSFAAAVFVTAYTGFFLPKLVMRYPRITI